MVFVLSEITFFFLFQVLERDLYGHRLELQVNDLKQQIKQMVELTTLQDQENKRMQK